MTTFSQLLSQYIERSGISDAELARSVGVRRQTIFRWKEGIVARPRHRDDVMRCADRLRLSPAERDGLLTAAGFAPESAPGPVDDKASLPADLPDIEQVEDIGNTQPDNVLLDNVQPNDAVVESPNRSSMPWIWAAAILLGVLLMAGFIGSTVANRSEQGGTSTPSAGKPTTEIRPSPPAFRAQAGETLLLVADFANYASDQGYNVSGRLREALEQEITTAELMSTTVRHWPEAVTNSERAGQVVADTNAALLIWGEYDSGRVRAIVSTASTSTDWERLLPNSSELPATINIDAPREVRSLAFLSLGRLYRNRDEIRNARNALKQVLEQQPSEDDFVATTRFYLATVLAAEPEPDYTAAIEQYDGAITLRPDWVNAHYNRGSAYLDRYYTDDSRDGDLDAAIADLTWSIQRRSGFANAYLNRGIAYYERRLPGDINQALADLDRAVSLAPDERRVRFNRGLARIRRGDDNWAGDFDQILEENEDSASAHNALCWGYALDGESELALPHCDRALALGLTRSVYDGRGIALALAGHYGEAINDLRSYLDELADLPEEAYERYSGPLVETWIAALSEGDDPFDATTLNSLR